MSASGAVARSSPAQAANSQARAGPFSRERATSCVAHAGRDKCRSTRNCRILGLKHSRCDGDYAIIARGCDCRSDSIMFGADMFANAGGVGRGEGFPTPQQADHWRPCYDTQRPVARGHERPAIARRVSRLSPGSDRSSAVARPSQSGGGQSSHPRLVADLEARTAGQRAFTGQGHGGQNGDIRHHRTPIAHGGRWGGKLQRSRRPTRQPGSAQAYSGSDLHRSPKLTRVNSGERCRDINHFKEIRTTGPESSECLRL